MATSKRKGIWGWMSYDWASQPFHTLIITFIFAPYFASSVASTPTEGQAIWGFAVGAGSIVIALLAPVLGAVADQSGPRKPWVLFFSFLLVVGSSGLWLAEPGAENVALILILFVVAMIGVEFTFIFTNAMLPTLGPPEDVGRISGTGWAIGYVGGTVTLLIVLLFLAPVGGSDVTLIGMKPLFGLDPAAGEGARITGPLTALWYVVFIIPFFLWTPDVRRNELTSGAVGEGLRQLWGTIKSLPGERSLFAYLMSSMFYRDGLNGLYAFGGIYAAGVLGWGLSELGQFGIIAALGGAVGAWVGGRVDGARGPKLVIVTCTIALIVISLITISTGPGEAFFMPVGEGSSLPTTVFMICGALIGAAGGSLQASSRSMLVRQADPDKMTEAFGIYALAGRATSFMAPVLIGYVTLMTDSQRIGVTPVIALFVIGLILMIWVKKDRTA